jgi:hypothetical protein
LSATSWQGKRGLPRRKPGLPSRASVGRSSISTSTTATSSFSGSAAAAWCTAAPTSIYVKCDGSPDQAESVANAQGQLITHDEEPGGGRAGALEEHF